MSAVLKKKYYTQEEYLAIERQAQIKSEYVDGEMFAMTGASREHNLININIASELRAQLKSRPCEVYINDMRVKAKEARSYHYPDIAAACDTPQFEDNHVDTLINPSVIIEVLSLSTEAYDRGAKFSHYRKIESLREYLLVAQDQPLIERYVRQGDAWLLTETAGLDTSVHLESIDCVLSLKEIYDKVAFEPDPSS
ncbi:Uma2 family endonuclease [Methylotuvimicrobium buryatense]|uniref:Uma2 family endonuclease n=1 Tax=Methylotuvimicrobium buryatense TaxID=95641 RepID=A0A4P9UQF6_METBY|nr:Uma2 family endonuclease [Methylotuvimicrobium buryatense]QCW82793.1 Uma2 family endonuclease [Methylotuvimicrobium buryatense]